MKRFLLIFSGIIHCLLLPAQKPVLDTCAFRKWESVEDGLLNNDGNYVCYGIYNRIPGSNKLELRSTVTDWKKEFYEGYGAVFSQDDKLFIFMKGIDSLYLVKLGTDQIEIIPNISEFYISRDDEGDWLAYRLGNDKSTLILRNLLNDREQIFVSVKTYQFTNKGERLLLGTEMSKDSNNVSACEQLINLLTGESDTVWNSPINFTTASGFVVNGKGDQVAFIVNNKACNKPGNEIWYFQHGTKAASRLADNSSFGIDAGLKIADAALEFSGHDKNIFLGLTTNTGIHKPRADDVKLELWSYADRVLRPLQDKETGQNPVYTAILNISEKRIIRLEHEEETTIARGGDFVLLEHGLGYIAQFESYWNRAVFNSYWLVSTIDGSRKPIDNQIVDAEDRPGLSPTGKWIICFNKKLQSYFSYETATGIRRNITKGISAIWKTKSNDSEGYDLNWVPWRNTWLREDEAVLINDKYDIWQVDPTGTRKPVNLTNGYGLLHHLKFELVEEGLLQTLSPGQGKELFLTAYNEITKKRGFYMMRLNQKKNPGLCFMGDYVFGDWGGTGAYNFPPVKAKHQPVYLVTRMSATEAPNYFITRDFKNYKAISDIQPQKNYNWLTSELLHWKTFDGVKCEGILYRPENFDSLKKYPVIFNYYERRSSELNLYRLPGFTKGNINIPWFVSHGYIVFVPDIHYKIGNPGRGAYSSIVSAALYLSKKSWIDRNKMGIQGHSFGSYQTNFVVTHTHIFAAACTASGVSDLVSWYGYGSTPLIRSTEFYEEVGQGRMGATPWEKQGSYISNSPVFNADKVTTPLLIMSNTLDRNIPFTQGVELFTALRRLGKRAWLLDYQNGGHTLAGKEAEDYTIRLDQFFDHYLKDAPAPIWMTRGQTTEMKYEKSDMEPDHQMKTPGPGLLFSSEQH